jgi:hypothetical protein
LGGHAVAFVATASAVTAAIFISLALLGLGFLMSLFGGGVLVILIVVYLIGAAKLTKAMGAGNETGLRVVKLTRQVAGVLIINTLFQGLNAVIGSGNALMPLQIITVDLLMPMGFSACALLLLRFIRGSFERKGQRLKSKSTRAIGSRSTASVSPATDFKESMETECTFTHGASATSGENMTHA